MKSKIRAALIGAVIAGIALEWFFAIAAYAQGTPAERAAWRAACEVDARRICSAGDLFAAFLGNPAPVAKCLADNKAKIAPACRAVLRVHRVTD